MPSTGLVQGHEVGEGEEAFPVALSGEPETSEGRMPGGVSEGGAQVKLREAFTKPRGGGKGEVQGAAGPRAWGCKGT